MTAGEGELLPARLAAALADLADGCANADDVAAKLLAAGCNGEPGDCYDCPVAAWLTRTLGLPAHASVMITLEGAEIEVAEPDDIWELPHAISAQPLPGVVREFVTRFDSYTQFTQLWPK